MAKLIPQKALVADKSGSGILHQEIEDTYAITCGAMNVVSDDDIVITATRAAVRTTAAFVNTASMKHSIAAKVLELRAFPSTVKMLETGIVLEAGPTSKIEVKPAKITLTCGASTLEMAPGGITLTCGGSILKLDPAKISALTQVFETHAVKVATSP